MTALGESPEQVAHLSEHTRIDVEQLNRLLTGVEALSVDYLNLIARGIGISAVDLVATARRAMPLGKAVTCPAEWCDPYGTHYYYYSELGFDAHCVLSIEHTRTCRHETGLIEVANQSDPIEIAAEIMEDADGELIGPCVNLGNGGDLYLESVEEVAAIAQALQEAGRVAFGEKGFETGHWLSIATDRGLINAHIRGLRATQRSAA